MSYWSGMVRALPDPRVQGAIRYGADHRIARHSFRSASVGSARIARRAGW
jgi:hypothetical protein